MTASDSCTPCREYVSEEQLQRKVRESFVRAHLDSIADQLHQARRVDDTDELRCRLDRAGAELDVLQELAKNLESEDQE